MNIATIYQEMESRNNLNLSVYLGYLQEHINSDSFNIEEVLNKDKKYLRALYCAAVDIKKSKNIASFICNDRHMPVFSAHMALIKCSSELLNINNSNQVLETMLENLVLGVRHSKITDPGTTLSFAFGFVLGTAIKRGIDTRNFFNKLDSSFIVDNDKLFQGFNSGLQEHSTCLVLNEQYLEDITDRYDNWEDRSRILSLSIFKAISVEKISGVSLNENNLNILEYFSGRTSSYNTFLTHYKNKLETVLLQRKTERAKQNVVQVQEIDLSKDDENVQLRKTVHNQQQEIVSLNTELSLYKSVFKQFQTLFPDLKETLEGSNSQDLLGKIQQLVSEQQSNVKNLQSYFEEGEKQKAIKDGFKKRL